MVVGRRLRNYQRDLESTETLKQASLSKPAAALKLLFFPSWGIQGQADFPLRPGVYPELSGAQDSDWPVLYPQPLCPGTSLRDCISRSHGMACFPPGPEENRWLLSLCPW